MRVDASDARFCRNRGCLDHPFAHQKTNGCTFVRMDLQDTSLEGQFDLLRRGVGCHTQQPIEGPHRKGGRPRTATPEREKAGLRPWLGTGKRKNPPPTLKGTTWNNSGDVYVVLLNILYKIPFGRRNFGGLLAIVLRLSLFASRRIDPSVDLARRTPVDGPNRRWKERTDDVQKNG